MLSLTESSDVPLDELARLAAAGSRIGSELFDSTESPIEGSQLWSLQARSHLIPPGNWPREDHMILAKALKAYVGVAAFHLGALGRLYGAGRPIHLHPVVTLIRSIAEASGQAWWHVEPWLNDDGLEDDVQPEVWDLLSRPILARIELKQLDELRARRRRLEVSHGKESDKCAEADAAFVELRERILRRHDEAEVQLTGGRLKWSLCGESLPELGVLVTVVTEYAYGQDKRGSGNNPYPMYSGYAHASLETVFAHAGVRPGPLSAVLAASEDELLQLWGVAFRTFSAGYEIAAGAIGTDLEGLQAWEQQCDAFLL